MTRRAYPGLRVTLVTYGAASLLHFVHNAVYLSAYPNMPRWLTPARVCAAWLAQTSVGLLGYVIYRYRSRPAGTLLMVTYALLGFAALDHYAVARVTAHSIAMSATIAIEAAAAAILLLRLAITARGPIYAPETRAERD